MKYIIICDYSDSSVHVYKRDMPDGEQHDETEQWIDENTPHSANNIHWMSSDDLSLTIHEKID